MSEAAGRIEYGWWVAFASGVLMAVSIGPLMQGASAIFAAVEEEYSWSRTQVAAAASLGQFAMALASPFAGAVIDRVGTARAIVAGLLLTGLSAIGLSFTHGLAGYYAAFLLMFAGFAFGGFMPCMTAVNRWLPRRRAAGMAFVMAGGSVGSVLVPGMAWGIEEYGWRPTVVVIGVIIIVLAPVLARVIGRPLPEPPGQTAEARDARTGRAPSGLQGFTAREALRTWAFHAMAFGHMLSNFAVAAVAAHVILRLTDVGMSLATASLILPVMGMTEFGGRLMGGLFGDSVNRRVALFFLTILQALSLVALAFTANFWMAVLFAVLWGMGFGTRGPVFHAMRADYFGPRAYATILGISSFALSLGMTASPVAVGWIFDRQQNYRDAFLGLAVTSFIAALLLLSAVRPRKREG